MKHVTMMTISMRFPRRPVGQDSIEEVFETFARAAQHYGSLIGPFEGREEPDPELVDTSLRNGREAAIEALTANGYICPNPIHGWSLYFPDQTRDAAPGADPHVGRAVFCTDDCPLLLVEVAALLRDWFIQKNIWDVGIRSVEGVRYGEVGAIAIQEACFYGLSESADTDVYRDSDSWGED